MTNPHLPLKRSHIVLIAILLTGLNIGMGIAQTFSRAFSQSNGTQVVTGLNSAAAIAAEPNILVGAGDISNCGSNQNDEKTAALLDVITGTVFTLGDNVYPDGTAQQFNDCYDPTWGRHKARTRPSSGNHDYHVAGAAGYYAYFGAAAGDADKGYYSYDIANWHIIVLNSECSDIGGCSFASPQGRWLTADLTAHPSSCLLAYWHKPRFSSGNHGSSTTTEPFWQMLYASGADVILSGHDHIYERFALQNPAGIADPVNGIRQFVVGTGGTGLVSLADTAANSEVRNDQTHGVLKLTLLADSYEWQFIPVAGAAFTDSGTDSCRGTGLSTPTSTATTDPNGTPTPTNTALVPTHTPGGATNTPTTTAAALTATPTITPGGVCTTGTQTFSTRISLGSDDAEQNNSSGAVDLNSSDLELINDGGANPQLVGLRFASVTIPQGATIANARIEFEVDEVDTGADSLLFQAQAADHPATFAATANDISSRPRTTASVAWNNLPDWTVIDAKQSTPNLAAVVQEVVNRSGWAAGNALVFVISGSGERTAEAVEGEPAAAALLSIQFCTIGSNTPVTTPTIAPTVPTSEGTPAATDPKIFLPVVAR